MTDDATPWLSDEQERVWRAWLSVNTRMPVALHRQLASDSGLSLPDFDVLVHLTDTPDGRIRVSELADRLQWERSRLSHHVKRMQARSLICREECPEDGRGAFVVITDQGRAAIEAAAPGHVRAVRRLIFDVLSDDEVDVLDRITGKVLDALAREQGSGARD